MASRPQGPFILEVRFEQRDDGGLRAHCDDVPGFVLSHADAEKVLADVEPALTVILSAMYGLPMMVEKAQPMTGEVDGMLPAWMCGSQYVGLAAAH